MTIFLENRLLLVDFKAGKKEALHEVYNAYFKEVERLISKGWISKKTGARSFINTAGDNDLRTELIQEIFLRAFSKKARLSYDGVRFYKNYLLMLARNVILNFVAAHSDNITIRIDRESDVERMNAHSTFSDESRYYESPEERLLWQRRIQAVHDYLVRLDVTLQQFAQLRFNQEMPLLRVARQLQITRGKARYMEQIIKSELKRFLESQDLISPDNGNPCHGGSLEQYVFPLH
ncbi:MAG: sigma-70 family RNA polymerase sigma factor [Deltaproteobacteria bacterium]|nr:sigma-70 family RNA polymerase sigma factor [Deltaproteobacteria bacterium]